MQIEADITKVSPDEIQEVQIEYLDMLKAILWMLDGAKYLWEENAPNM